MRKKNAYNKEENLAKVQQVKDEEKKVQATKTPPSAMLSRKNTVINLA